MTPNPEISTSALHSPSKKPEVSASELGTSRSEQQLPSLEGDQFTSELQGSRSEGDRLYPEKQAQKKRFTLNPEWQRGKAMQIEIQLDEDRANKLAQIQQQTEQDATELIDRMVGEAIDHYYQKIQPPAIDPLAKLKQSKFIGCFQGPPDLSVNSKAYFHEIMQEKFPQQQDQ